MTRGFLSWFALGFIFGVCQPAYSSAAQRAWSFGLSGVVQTEKPLVPGESVGTGLYSRYEMYISPKFNLGIQTAVRSFSRETFQVSYGLIMQHAINGPRSQNHWYVSYGLLLQVISVSKLGGTGTAHDTRLTLGKTFCFLDRLYFLEASYHISRLRFFEVPAKNLDHLELVFGITV